ncbi:TetR family transcriptional regulator [Alphaproteobacteria bacterium KMM 3653]|uniref:TetR family transcriptional regulator n=1 Tax=Harenicola maris TaxID=2841044 RepID=A0AAP2G5Y3_9RHOB|nr:TetR family transcriptional regulator [Harenicola maris]
MAASAPKPKAGEAVDAPVRRDPVQTQANILKAATHEFAAYGFQGARTDRIALDAGIGKRMIFHYFDSKEGLFAAVLEGVYARIRTAEEGLDLTNRSPVEAIAALVGFSFDWYTRNPEFVPLLNEENLHQGRHLRGSHRAKDLTMPLVDKLQDILKRGEEEGVFRSGVDPVDLYISIAAIGYFYFSNTYTLGRIFDRDFAKEELIAKRRSHVIDMISSYLMFDPGPEGRTGGAP